MKLHAVLRTTAGDTNSIIYISDDAEKAGKKWVEKVTSDEPGYFTLHIIEECRVEVET